MRILVIEDEPKLADALREGLERGGYELRVAHTGEEGFFLAHAESFDLMIVDVMLPGRDGLQILENLRAHGIHTPVLLLTAKDALEDRIRGLDCGADDYMAKPFAFSELLARVRALLRRGKQDKPSSLRLADLQLDLLTRRVTRGAEVIDVTVREFEFLEYLLRNQGNVVSRGMLARDVWKEPGRQTPLDNVIDVHIARLRRKLDDPFDRKLLHTVRGVGFVLKDREDESV